MQLTAREDHRRMLEQLHITALRAGRNANNPVATNYANYNETRANPFPQLPDPLVLKNGEPVADAKTWWERRRPEIVEDFEREVYGRTPKTTPKVKWEVTSVTRGTNGDIPVITKQLVGHVDNSAYPAITVNLLLTLTTPANSPRPVPVVMQFGFIAPGANGAGAMTAPGAANGAARTNFTYGPGGFAGGAPSWQQQVMARGWGYAIFSPTSAQADSGAGLTQGVIGLVNQGRPRSPEDWGTLSAWAWGASRALDYFETDKAVAAHQVGLQGHSRYGKAALLAMALDQRFALAYVSSSGEGGAKLHRRNWGEVVENVAGPNEYHWMGGNFLKYAGPLNWGDLPVDSHELLALCAPRPVFLGAGSTQADGWVDARGSFLAAVGAGPVYRLLGKLGLSAAEFPPMGTGVTDGELAFLQHGQGHTDTPNWPAFLSFADRYLQRPPPAPNKPAKSKTR